MAKPLSASSIVNCCQGGTALVAGNGPSLRLYSKAFLESFPFSIGVNTIANTFTPTVIYNIEPKPFKWASPPDPDQLGIKWITCKQLKDDVNADYFVRLDRAEKGIFPLNKNAFDNKGACANMSSFGALHIAYLTGAKRIYIVGVDFREDPKGQIYHDEKPRNNEQAWYLPESLDPMRTDNINWFANAFAVLKKDGARCYCLSPYSDLKGIDRISQKSVIIKGTCSAFNGKQVIPAKGHAKADKDAHKPPMLLNIDNKKPILVVLGPGDMSLKVNIGELRQSGNIMAVNAGVIAGYPDYCLITNKNRITPRVHDRLKDYTNSNCKIFSRHSFQDVNYHLVRECKAIVREPTKDSGIYYNGGGAIAALQMGKALGYEQALLIGFDFKMNAGGKGRIGDRKSLDKTARKDLRNHLTKRKQELQEYISISSMRVFVPAWSDIKGATKLDIQADLEGKSIPRVPEPRNEMKIAVFSPNRKCAVRDAIDGMVNGMLKLNCKVTEYHEANGISARVEDLLETKPDMVFFCPQINRQRYGMEEPEQEVFDKLHGAGIATVFMLFDEPYENGWYDIIAKRATACLVNEPNAIRHYDNAFYYPLTANSALHIEQQVADKYKSNVLFVGGMQAGAFTRRLRYFEEARETLDQEGNLFIGPDMQKLGYSKATIISRYVPNEEIVKYYNGAKICLNIHRDSFVESKGKFNRTDMIASHLNPRAFEITGCGAFMLCDFGREELMRLMPWVKNFKTPVELASMIKHYLANPNLRDKELEKNQKLYHENFLTSLLPKLFRVGEKYINVTAVIGPLKLGDKPAVQGVQEILYASGRSRNQCAEEARGKYIMFVPGDTTVSAEAVAGMVKAIEDNGADFTYGHHRYGNKVLFSRAFTRAGLRRQYYAGEVIMVRSEALMPYDETLKRFLEWDLLIRMCESGKKGILTDMLVSETERSMDRGHINIGFEEGWKCLRPKHKELERIRFK